MSNGRDFYSRFVNSNGSAPSSNQMQDKMQVDNASRSGANNDMAVASLEADNKIRNKNNLSYMRQNQNNEHFSKQETKYGNEAAQNRKENQTTFSAAERDNVYHKNAENVWNNTSLTDTQKERELDYLDILENKDLNEAYSTKTAMVDKDDFSAVKELLFGASSEDNFNMLADVAFKYLPADVADGLVYDAFNHHFTNYGPDGREMKTAVWNTSKKR